MYIYIFVRYLYIHIYSFFSARPPDAAVPGRVVQVSFAFSKVMSFLFFSILLKLNYLSLLLFQC